MKLNEIEIKKRIMKLKQEKLRLEAPTTFSCFLGYSNPKYDLEWFHKIIADHCQQLLGHVRLLEHSRRERRLPQAAVDERHLRASAEPAQHVGTHPLGSYAVGLQPLHHLRL